MDEDNNDHEEIYIEPDSTEVVIEVNPQDNNAMSSSDEDEDEDDSPSEDGEYAANVRTSKWFLEHTDQVFCCCLEQNTCAVAITGGGDDHAYAWTLSDQVVKWKHKFEDSVTHAGFSHDYKYFFAADIAGHIQVGLTATAQEITTLNCGDVEWVKWHPQAHVIVAGTSISGDIWLWKIPSGDPKIITGPGSSCTCSSFFKDGRRISLGYADGTARCVDLKAGTLVSKFLDNDAHKESVTCIDCHSNDTIFATGSSDGYCHLYNETTNKVLAKFFQAPSTPEADPSIESIKFSESNIQLLVTGQLSGDLNIWDLTTQQLRSSSKSAAGITKMEWLNPESCFLFSAHLNGDFCKWDTRSGSCVKTWELHEGEVLDFVIARDEKTVISCCSDSSVRMTVLDE